MQGAFYSSDMEFFCLSCSVLLQRLSCILAIGLLIMSSGHYDLVHKNETLGLFCREWPVSSFHHNEDKVG